ncbi:MAG: flagellin N-terminal helical domain-containing protein [Nocardioides sp.]
MGLRINQNIAAMNSYRNLSVTDGQMAKSLEKLSSGFRINRAADDAAGLAISEGLRSQIGGLKVAVRNTQDGVSVVQTAEGALTETHSILQRMRDLSVQAANDGGLNADAKNNIQSEMSQLQDELTRIADTTTFNGTKLLDGNYNKSFQVGANAGETISVAIGSVGEGMDAKGLGVDVVNVTTSAAGLTGTATSGVIGTAGTVKLGSTDWTAATADFTDVELTGTLSIGGKDVNLADVDVSSVTDVASLETAISDALVSAGVDTSDLTVTAGANGIDLTYGTAPTTAAEAAAQTVAFDALSGAEYGISKLDDAIKQVSTTRAGLGAIQNRFDHTINNLNVAVENLSASESRIRDTDMAAEMMEFTRAQILSQAGTAMLAQANQAPQGVLRLLQ